MSNSLQLITDDIYRNKDVFISVLADQSINFEREAGFAIQILSSNDYAMTAAASNRQSVVDAVTNVAAIGISLNPAKKQAYLVPRKGKICLDISYIGLLDLAISSGSLKWGQADLVREHDVFQSNGFDKAPTHTFNPFSKDRGEVVGTYVVVKTADGEYLTTTMTIDECNAIRDRSESWKAGGKGPWKTDPGEMIKKTVIKRAYKLWPKTDRLDNAIHHLNTDGGEGLGFGQSQERPEDWVDVAPYLADALKTQTDAEALSFWKAHNPKFLKQQADHRRLKDTIASHRQSIKDRDEARTIEAEPTKTVTNDEFVAGLDSTTYAPE
jgi:recombination protein RecT